MSKTRSNGT